MSRLRTLSLHRAPAALPPTVGAFFISAGFRFFSRFPAFFFAIFRADLGAISEYVGFINVLRNKKSIKKNKKVLDFCYFCGIIIVERQAKGLPMQNKGTFDEENDDDYDYTSRG